MGQIFAEKISTATIAIALFGIVFCLMQTKYTRVNRSFAVFLAAVTVNNIPDAFNSTIWGTQSVYFLFSELVIWLPSALCLAPLFWIYVFTLTSTSQQQTANAFRHFLLAAFSLLMGLAMLFSPQDVRDGLVSGGQLPDSGWALAVVVVAMLHAIVYPQMAIYLFLIVRRMMMFRTLLRDYYASTEEHELRWIFVIGVLAALFWLARTIIFLIIGVQEQQDIPDTLFYTAGFVSLALVAAMTLWGLRQRPPLVPDEDEEQPPKPTQILSADQSGGKYEKSALSPETSTRIARKLRAAMETDHLHRDPNLSLWALARHIGASPNYISQTLNEVMGENFFDFVNGYRIAEAMTLLTTTNASVLTITYDVGFNARSSFYNAFKRVSGQTPTSYRKKMSHPVGMDD